MGYWNRRRLLKALAFTPFAAIAQTARQGKPLDITEYQPHSMLEVPEHHVEKARFPVIDVHTHLSFSRDEANKFLAGPSDLLPVMDRRNLRMLVNLTGGRGSGLRESVAKFDKARPGRFI